MEFCTKCAKQNTDTAKFCTGCGNWMGASHQPTTGSDPIHQETNQNKETTCAHCGKSNPANAKFCSGCGNSTISAFAVQTNKNQVIEQQILDEKQCDSCGIINKATAKFCIRCGASLAKPADKHEYSLNKILTDDLADKSVTIADANNKPVIEVPTATLPADDQIVQNTKETEDGFSGSFEIEASLDTTEQQNRAEETEKEPDQVPVQTQAEQKTVSPTEDTSGLNTDTVNITAENSNNQGKTEQHKDFYSLDTLYTPLDEIHESSDTYKDSQIASLSKTTVDNDNDSVAEEALSPEELDELYSGERKGRFKKKMLRTIIVFIILSVGIGLGYFLFRSPGKQGNIGATNKSTSAETNLVQDSAKQMDTLLKEQDRDKLSENNSQPVVAESGQARDTVKTASGTIGPTAPETIPHSPVKADVIRDLSGIKLCNSTEISANSTLLSFGVTQKNSRQCRVAFSFVPSGNTTQYIVTALYENVNNNFAYKSYTCTSKPVPEVKEEVPVVTASKHDVRAGLMSYLAGKKSFGGVQYDNPAEISIVSIGLPQEYAETGNTSYIVKILINSLERQCQVVYTATGKLFVNSLK